MFEMNMDNFIIKTCSSSRKSDYSIYGEHTNKAMPVEENKNQKNERKYLLTCLLTRSKCYSK